MQWYLWNRLRYYREHECVTLSIKDSQLSLGRKHTTCALHSSHFPAQRYRSARKLLQTVDREFLTVPDISNVSKTASTRPNAGQKTKRKEEKDTRGVEREWEGLWKNEKGKKVPASVARPLELAWLWWGKKWILLWTMPVNAHVCRQVSYRKVVWRISYFSISLLLTHECRKAITEASCRSASCRAMWWAHGRSRSETPAPPVVSENRLASNYACHRFLEIRNRYVIGNQTLRSVLNIRNAVHSVFHNCPMCICHTRAHICEHWTNSNEQKTGQEIVKTAKYVICLPTACPTHSPVQGSPTRCPRAPGRPSGPSSAPARHVLKLALVKLSSF